MNESQMLHNQIQKNYSPRVQKLSHMLILLWITAGTLLPLVAFFRTKSTIVLLSLAFLVLPTYILFHNKKLFHRQRRKEALLFEAVLITLSAICILLLGLPYGGYTSGASSSAANQIPTTTSITPIQTSIAGIVGSPATDTPAPLPSPINTPSSTPIIDSAYILTVSFCNDITTQNYQDAYNNLFTANLQKKTSVDKLESTFAKTMGCSYSQTMINNGGQVTTEIITENIDATPHKGLLYLAPEADTWKVTQIQFPYTP